MATDAYETHLTGITFEVPAVPVAQPRQRHRVGKVNGRMMAMNYTPTKSPVNAFKATVRQSFAAAYQGAPLDGPLRLSLVFTMERPGRLIWKKRPMPACPHTAKPDLDNLCKSVKDALAGLAFRNDSQVCELHAIKRYAAGNAMPGVWVNIQPVHA